MPARRHRGTVAHRHSGTAARRWEGVSRDDAYDLRTVARTVAQKIPPRMAAVLMPRRRVRASPINSAPPRAVMSGTLNCTTAAVGTLSLGNTEYHST